MPKTNATVRQLGIPVRSLNWVRLHPGRNAKGQPILLATMGEDAEGLFVSDIDLATGHCTQHYARVKSANFPTATYMNPTTGVLYVGSAYAGHLHRYDPNLPPAERTLQDLGKIDPEMTNFPCRIDEAPDGSIWIGAYGGASMTRFNPADGKFTRLGRMDPVDMYFYPLCGRDGSVAGLVRMTAPHVVAVNPLTGETRTLGPTINPDKSTTNARDPKMLDLIKGIDGLLYITTDQGNWRVSGLEAVPVDNVPAPMPAATLADGSKATFAEKPQFEFRKLVITAPDGKTRTHKLDWTSGGTSLFMQHLGPDGKLYGSSILPEHLFRSELDPKHESDIVDLGQCSTSGGEVYSMANLNGKIYIHSYPEAKLSIYDPAKPYRFGLEEGSNPREVGRPDHVSYRPVKSLAGPAGKVWTVAVPDYGLWGGTLTWYHPPTGTFGSHRHLIENCSPTSLAYVKAINQLVVGLNIDGGTGTTPKAEHGGFVFWNPDTDTPVAATTLDIEHLATVNDVCDTADGKLYAIVQQWTNPQENLHKREVVPSLALIDPAARKVLSMTRLPEACKGFVLHGLYRGKDDVNYGAGSRWLYRIKPGTTEIECLYEADENIMAPGPVVGNSRYFAHEHRLMMATW